jgi:hypothetical protein
LGPERERRKIVQAWRLQVAASNAIKIDQNGTAGENRALMRTPETKSERWEEKERRCRGETVKLEVAWSKFGNGGVVLRSRYHLVLIAR